MIAGGELGTVYAADLVFHNAYGPDKAWFYDLARSGGGCLIDLGTHLVDLALWVLGTPTVENVESRLFHQGRRLPLPPDVVEDCAFVGCDMADGTHLRLACSWRLSAGCEAVIEATFYGTEGAVTLRNRDGSFYRFAIEHKRRTACETIAEPAENWGAGAITGWVHDLAESPRYRDDCEHLRTVADVLDRSYGR
jgi:predicted dehydrogenase